MTASAQLPVFHVVGFTGHRCLSDPAAVERVLQQVLGELRAQTDVEWLGLSSVAEGADMIFARTARQLGIGWEAVLPLPPAEFRADFSPEAWRQVEELLGELEAHLTAVIHEQADELVHNALREMEALLLEQVSDRLKAELPQLISRVIAEHFRGTGRAN